MTTKKSLSEDIRDIVDGKEVLKEAGKPVLTDNDGAMTPKPRTSNMKTLAPGSKFKEGMKTLPGEVVDLGGDTPTEVKKQNPDATKGAKGKDTSKSSISAVKKEPMKKIAEEEDDQEINDDEIITEEELIAFANELSEEGYSDEQIEEALDQILENFEEVILEDVDGNEGEGEEEEEEIQEIDYPTIDLDDIDLSQDIEALGQGEELSEEFKNKAKLIFETVVKSKISEYQKALDEAFEASLVEAVREVEKNLSEEVETFLDYTVQNWVSENEVAIESGLRTELTEDFIEGFMDLCREHYIDIPEEKVDIIEQLADEVADLQGKLDEEIANNVELNSIINEAQKEVVFYESVEGLTDVEIERLKELAEEIEFRDSDDFAAKIETLRESYFPDKAVISKTVVNEDNIINEEVDKNPIIDRYADAIGRKPVV